MAGPGETLGSPRPPLAIRPCFQGHNISFLIGLGRVDVVEVCGTEGTQDRTLQPSAFQLLLFSHFTVVRMFFILGQNSLTKRNLNLYSFYAVGNCPLGIEHGRHSSECLHNFHRLLTQISPFPAIGVCCEVSRGVEDSRRLPALPVGHP
jgi:hypothetical protein